MPLAGPDIVLYQKEEQIVTITLNRPERMNSISLEMRDLLAACWARFREDDDARVAIVTGTGDRAFCTGKDLKEEAARVARDPSVRAQKLGPFMINDIDSRRAGLEVLKPTIAAINGIATAGGFQLAMQCDLRIAADNARFGIGEIKWGRGTPWAVPAIWQMPLAIAYELFLLGEFMTARRLHEVGWLNEVVPWDQLMPAARKLAGILCDNAPLSVKAAKELFLRSTEATTRAGLEAAKIIYDPVYASDDAVEGPRAFAEKRKPLWKGR